MYEAELNRKVESIDTIPPEIQKRFTEYRDRIVARTLLPWGEHCTECAWPTCFTSCELYTHRSDGACRLFVNGMVRIPHGGGAVPYLLKITFKGWAKLWTLGNAHCHKVAKADSRERSNIFQGGILRNLPFPNVLQKKLLLKYSYIRRQKYAESVPVNPLLPDFFLFECYNPNERPIEMSLTIRPKNKEDKRVYQRLIQCATGFNREKIPFSEVIMAIDIHGVFEVELTPNDCDDTVLYFGIMDFVKERDRNEPKIPIGKKKCKCIVWDLDNTLWDGILIEDGPEKIRLRTEVVDVIKELDQRGILNSIASKNNPDDAMTVLKQHNIDDYFLFPQIGWHPKSTFISRIISSLNIGVDTLIFVDDQVFEREEVKAAWAQIEVVDAADCTTLINRPECQVPITDDSKNRRHMYRQQQSRTAAQENYDDDYNKFLKECNLQLTVTSLNESNINRIYELAQRTNQMNFSGNRYRLEELVSIMQSEFLETYVLKCSDRFGSYGIVGFAVVDTREPRLLDLLFSCRIQSKRIEHTFFTYLLKRFVEARSTDLYANYRKTERNAFSGKVFEDMSFETTGEKNGITSLVYKSGREIPDDGIVNVVI